MILEFQVFYKFNEFILCARHTQQLVDGMRVPAPESKEDQNQGSSKQLNQSIWERNNDLRDAGSEKKGNP